MKKEDWLSIGKSMAIAGIAGATTYMAQVGVPYIAEREGATSLTFIAASVAVSVIRKIMFPTPDQPKQ